MTAQQREKELIDQIADKKLYYDSIQRAMIEYGETMSEKKFQSYYRLKYLIWAEIQDLQADLDEVQAGMVVESELRDFFKMQIKKQ
jgi:hypothetical protein